MKISLIQMDVKIGEPEANYARAESLIRLAAEEKPDVIMLPEMWNTGYSLKNIMDIADHDGERTADTIGPLAKEYGVNIIAGSVSNIVGGKAYNALMVFDRAGKRIAGYNKIHMFKLMEEHLYISPGDSLCLFSLDGVPCGAVICYDIRFPELIRTLALQGCQLLFVPAEWPYPRLGHWRALLIARAIENQMFVAGCNRCGVDGETSFFGHSMIIDPWGEVLGELQEEKEQILTVDIEQSLVSEVRKKIPVFDDRKPETYRIC